MKTLSHILDATPSARSSGGAGSSNAPPPIPLIPSPSTIEYDSGPEHHRIGTYDEDDEDDGGSDDTLQYSGSVTNADAQELYSFMSDCRNGEYGDENIQFIIDMARKEFETGRKDNPIDLSFFKDRRESLFLNDAAEIGDAMPSPCASYVISHSEGPSYADEPVELHMAKAFSEFYAVHSGEELPPLRDGEHYVTLIWAQGLKRTVVQREANILDLNDCNQYENEVHQSMLE